METKIQSISFHKNLNVRRFWSHLAHDVAKWPISQTHRRHNEGDANEKTFVCHGQIQNVQIGDCLHFCVAQDDVDDERVSHETYDKDGAIQTL